MRPAPASENLRRASTNWPTRSSSWTAPETNFGPTAASSMTRSRMRAQDKHDFLCIDDRLLAASKLLVSSLDPSLDHLEIAVRRIRMAETASDGGRQDGSKRRFAIGAALYANALGDAEIGCKQISETYWKMQRAIDKIDLCHGCKCLSDKGHTLLDECIETLGRLAAVLQAGRGRVTRHDRRKDLNHAGHPPRLHAAEYGILRVTPSRQLLVFFLLKTA